MNAKDWKMNPKYNKFVRSVNKNGPLRQGTTVIDWKTSKVKTIAID